MHAGNTVFRRGALEPGPQLLDVPHGYVHSFDDDWFLVPFLFSATMYATLDWSSFSLRAFCEFQYGATFWNAAAIASWRSPGCPSRRRCTSRARTACQSRRSPSLHLSYFLPRTGANNLPGYRNLVKPEKNVCMMAAAAFVGLLARVRVMEGKDAPGAGPLTPSQQYWRFSKFLWRRLWRVTCLICLLHGHLSTQIRPRRPRLPIAQVRRPARAGPPQWRVRDGGCGPKYHAQ